MGNFAIIIRGHGPHQNDLSYDAERIAQRLVDELRACGHDVETASVETGGTSIVLAGAGAQELPPVKDPDGPAARTYERYLGATGGKSAKTGAVLPVYDEQDPVIKTAWRAAADPKAPRFIRPPNG
jgi:hypothetical protein